MTEKSYFWDSAELYYNRVNRVRAGAAPIGYWRLNEATGALVALDSSGNNRNSTALSGVVFGQAGIGDGSTAALFDGVNDYINVAGTFPAAVNVNLGSAMLWFKVDSAVWTDGTIDTSLRIFADATNYIRFAKSNAANTFFVEWMGGGASSSRSKSTSTTSWTCVILTWNKASNRLRMYWNGVQEGADVAMGGVFVGAMANAYLGNTSAGTTNPFNGLMAHVAVWNFELTADEVTALSTLGIYGDATYAPYNATEFNTWMYSAFLANNVDAGYIVPGYKDDLAVASAGITAHSVVVKTGAACVNYALYTLDKDVTIPIERAAANMYRRDSLILRINNNLQEVRLAVLKGGENANKNLVVVPTLTRSAAIYEVEIARIFVDGNSTYIDPSFVLDKRKFIYNIFDKMQYDGGGRNLLRNSEWMAVSGAGIAGGVPDEWRQVESFTPALITAGSGGSGRSDLALTLSAGSVAQWVDVSGHTFTLKYNSTFLSFDTTLMIKGFRKTGDESSMRGYSRSHTNDTGDQQLTVTFPEDDIEKLYIEINPYSNAGSIPQVLLVPGYHPGGQRPVSEVVMFSRAATDASWTATAKSTGTTVIDFTATFGQIVKQFTESVILRIRGRDSGSAAAASCYLRVLDNQAFLNNTVYGHLEISGTPNDVWKELTVVVPVIRNFHDGSGTSIPSLRLDIVATGAATFDATVEVVGIII